VGQGLNSAPLIYLHTKRVGVVLLRDWRSPEQRAQYDAERYFDVVDLDSGKRYRIHDGALTNVHEIDDYDRLSVAWCSFRRDPWQRAT
jgi:hypothetical protein